MENTKEYRRKIEEIICLIKGREIIFSEADGDYDEMLTGSKYLLNTRELMYLFLEVQREFSVEFNKEDIVDYQFNTINKISENIKRHRESTNA